jgi:hypothetical protein
MTSSTNCPSHKRMPTYPSNIFMFPAYYRCKDNQKRKASLPDKLAFSNNQPL